MPKFDEPATWPDDYAPGLIWIKKKYPYWRVPKRYLDAGYPGKPLRPSGRGATQQHRNDQPLCPRALGYHQQRCGVKAAK